MRSSVEVAGGDVVAPAVPRRGPALLLAFLFIATTLLGATLLFGVEPMVAKMLLPPYGGSPMVWNTAVLFFQAALLAGYGYAHWSVRRLGMRRQPVIQIALALLPLLALPVALPVWAEAPESAPTALWLLLVLVVMVGAPFTILATTGPMVQRWYAWSGLPRAHDPYFLYAAGNVGSLLALLAYPFVIEPLATLQEQARWWALGYGVFAVLIITCAVAVWISGRGTAAGPSSGDEISQVDGERVGWRRRGRWMVLAFIPSSLMLGVTTHITTDISPVPLIWVVPLALYLVTFIVAFGSRRLRWVKSLVVVTPLVALVVPWIVVSFGHLSVAVMIPLDLALVVLAGLVCHGLLATDRPGVRRLTEFYLFVSIGGALGGVFNGLLAPLVFDWVAELPLVIAMLGVALLIWMKISGKEVIPQRATRFPIGFILLSLVLAAALYIATQEWWSIIFGAVPLVAWRLAPGREHRLALMAGLLVIPLFALSVASAEVRERTFFGTYKVTIAEGSRTLVHGTTVHGYQRLNASERRLPVSYYSRQGPMGDIFEAQGDRLKDGRIGVAGLGIGGLAAYGQAGQQMDFYEIDPAVVRLARSHFTYLRDCKCDVRTIVGDARLRLEKVPDGTYGAIILDAFTSDAVPVHLLTREAIELYESKLRPGGMLVFNISNRHLDLGPMLGAAAQEVGLTVLRADDESSSATANPSSWVAIARSDAELAPLRELSSRWRRPRAGGPVWTDTYSSLFGVLKS